VILSDRSIREQIAAGRIGISPYDEALVQPASIDVRVDGRFLVFKRDSHPFVDVREDLGDLTEEVVKEPSDPFILHPGQLVLAQTVEEIALPADLVARVDGKSSLGRLGLTIHSTAGWCDPGFEGTITLELSNELHMPITVWPGMAIGQVSFMRLDRPAERPYGSEGLGSKYQGQSGPTASRYHANFAHRDEAAGEPRGHVLRGRRIREVAIAFLIEQGGGPLHYVAWLRSLEKAGYEVGGERPEAVFLNQVKRSPLCSASSEPGLYEIDREAPRRLRRREAELRAKVAATEGGEELDGLLVELRRVCRDLGEVEAALAGTGVLAGG
jgi:dCTP deaminase